MAPAMSEDVQSDGALSRREFLQRAAVLAAAGLSGSNAKAAVDGRKRRIIIDTDPGVDDALAILLALRSSELVIEAITPVAGNVPLSLTLPNALRMLELAGRTDIPVAVGADHPLERQLITATYAHGNNGLAGVEFPEPRTKPVAEAAPQLMRRLIRGSPGEISIIAIGPLTNLAMAFRADPALPSMVRDITIMGGSLSGGNITPAAEFNAYVDPEAAQIVFHCGVPITMIGLDVTRKVSVTEDVLQKLSSAGNPLGRAAGKILRAQIEQVRRTGIDDGVIHAHDALAMASLIEPSIVSLQPMHIEVETRGELTAGETLGYRKPMRRSAPRLEASADGGLTPPEVNAKVALEVDVGRFLGLLTERLSA
jgi:inosine-uridine nucleoside N-ribohydrolase